MTEAQAENRISAGHVVDELVARGKELFTLPKVAVDLLELAEQPHTDASVLRECIERDPALTARLLRVVNSSLFGLANRVTDLTHAVGLLGIKPLKMLVLGFSLPPALFEGLDEEALQQYWRTSLIRATAARELAKATGSADPEEAFVAGLLEGLGILLLIQHLRDAYTRFYLQVTANGRELAEVEQEQFGFHHRQVTARLLQNWHFPRELVEAISRPRVHGDADSLPVLAGLLCIANQLTRLLSPPNSTDIRALIQDAEAGFGLSIEQIHRLVDRLEASVPPLAEIFALKWDQLQYVECLAAAHRAMSELTEDSVTRSSVVIGERHESPREEAAAVRSALDSWLDAEPVLTPRVDHSRANKTRPAAAARPAGKQSQSMDPGLAGRLHQAILLARRTQRSVGLCLFEYENSTELQLAFGLGSLAALEEILRQLIEAELEPSMPAATAGDGQVAAICIGHDRRRVTAAARRVLDQIGHRVEQELGGGLPATASAGTVVVEIPTKNLSPVQVIESAERCLYAAHAAGGQTVKTIEI